MARTHFRVGTSMWSLCGRTRVVDPAVYGSVQMPDPPYETATHSTTDWAAVTCMSCWRCRPAYERRVAEYERTRI